MNRGGMRIQVVTLFPELVEALRLGGVTARALERGLLDVRCWNPRDFARDRHRTVDDRPYGGGPGMVMRVEPLRSAIRAAKAAAGEGARVIYLSPQGRRLDQAGLRELAARPGLVLVAGRYEGVDERLVEEMVDEEWSIEVIDGRAVPEVLLSGDHAAIARWRRKQSLGRTWARRPDLLAGRELSEEDRRLLEEYIAEHREKREQS